MSLHQEWRPMRQYAPTRTTEDSLNQIGKCENYLSYITNQPRAQKLNVHGAVQIYQRVLQNKVSKSDVEQTSEKKVTARQGTTAPIGGSGPGSQWTPKKYPLEGFSTEDKQYWG